MIVQKSREWPWPQMRELRGLGVGVWLEVTEEDWWYALEVLPPIMLRGGVFQLSEPSDADSAGNDVHATYVRASGRIFAAELSRPELSQALGVLFSDLGSSEGVAS